MKILAAHPGPAFSVQDVYTGYVEALRADGHHVVEFNLHDRLCFFDGAFLQHDTTTPDNVVFRKALTPDQAIQLSINGLYASLYMTKPDVLLVISGFMIPHELLDLARNYGTRVVVLHTETPYEDERQVAMAQHADLNILNDPITIDKYPRAIYLPHAYRPTLHRPGPALRDYKSDFAFVGTGYKSRIAFLEAMDFDGVDVLLAGNWAQLDDGSPLRKFVAHDVHECLDNEQTVDVYRATKVALNLYRKEGDSDRHEGWSMGPREVELAAVGCFFLREPRPEGDRVLDMLPTFHSPAEATDQLRHYLTHPAETRERAEAAREAVADRTFDVNVRQLIDHLEGTTTSGSHPRPQRPRLPWPRFRRNR